MNKEPTINFEHVLLKAPLLKEYPLYDTDTMDLLNLLFYIKDKNEFNNFKIIDSYCTICKKDTTFTSEDSHEIEQQKLRELLISAEMFNGYPLEEKKIKLINELEKHCTFIRKFNCPRKPFDSAHSQIFIFRVIGTTLIKVGQHPTLAEISNEGLKKYRKFNADIYSELNRAVGLSAHGIGIGSFVYLRRIIEKHILHPKLNELISEGKITNEQLFKSDFKEKIKLAKNKLPTFLVENTKIYSVLSKGIHELEEEECIGYFSILKNAIEIILDEQIEKNEKDKKNKLIASQLNKLK